MDNILKALPELIRFAEKLAYEAGSITNQYFRSANLTTEIKPDQTPVTIADKLSEEKMRELINHHYPHHGIISEEFGAEKPYADLVWTLDPIDGTKSFIAGKLDFGSIIGLLYQGKPILGLVYQPVLKDLVIGDNFITKHNNQIVRVRPINNIKEATLLVSDVARVGKYHADTGFKKLLKEVRQQRNLGNCYGYTMVARGLVDVMIDPIMNIWDIAGLIPIIHGAGGIITDYYGNDPLSGKGAVASSQELHNKIIALLNHDELFH